VAWWAGALGATFGLVWLTVALEWSWLLELERDLGRQISDAVRGNAAVVDALRVVSLIGEPTVIRLLLLLVAGYAAIRRRFDVAWWLTLSVLLQLLIAPGLKLVEGRARPTWPASSYLPDSYAFPSGHAAGAGLFVAAAVLLTHSVVSRRSTRLALDAIWFLVGLVIGLDRVLLGVHYPSDVLAGWAVGAAIPLALAAVLVPWAVFETGPAPTTTGIRPSRLAVVLNPTKVNDVAAFQTLMNAAVERHGWAVPRWYETTAEDAGIAMTHAALADGAEMVVAAGGDGTVRVVCSELARTGVPLGIVPLGTGNLLARNLDVPLRVQDAMTVALSGQDRAIDVVGVSGDGLPESCFTVMGGLGFDAAIMAGASDALKARMGWRAYVVSAIRNLRYPASRVEISVDDGPYQRHRARTVVIGNVGLLQAGIPLLPDARVDDGRLDVVVIAPQRLIGWVFVVARVLRRGRHTDASLARMTGRSVVVRANQPVARQLDGDPIGEGRELRATVMAGTLLVRVPR
jgi:diacylglycerol kinase family enzyme/membrane-associated phospholipid phosphatase